MNTEAARDPNLALALYGDSIYKVVQKGARDLEKAWIPLGRTWYKVLRQSLATGIFGMGTPLADGQWLSYVLFQPAREWPSGLTPNQQKALMCLRTFEGYAPLPDSEGFAPASDTATIKGLQRFAAFGEKKLLYPMYAAFEEVRTERGAEIQALCPTLYSEECTLEEGKDMFKGDLKRGLAVGTLGVTPATERVFRHFFAWLETPG